MKKRVLGVLLSAVMVMALMVGCGGSGGDSSGSTDSGSTDSGSSDDASTGDSAATENTSDEARAGDLNGDGKIVVGYISKNIVDPFHAPINDHAKATLDAMVADGVIDEWTGILDGETDAAKQIDRADECIAKNCDYVIFLPAESTASDPAVTKMNDAGIQVMVVNSKTDSTDDLAASYAGSDDVQAGEMLAEWVIDQVPDGGKYVHCQGIIGNSAQIQRGEGIENIMSGNDKFESVGDYPCEWSGDKAANVATDMMSKYGDELKAVICDNDDMSSAAQKVCNDAGRSDIVCVGVDGNENPLAMVAAGEMGATVLQDGVGQVDAAIEQIKNAAGGGTVEKEIMIPFVLVTKENVADYLK